MSMSLALFPLDGPESLTETLVICYDRLEVPQNYSVFGQLRNLSSDDRPDIPKEPTIPCSWIPPQLSVQFDFGGGRQGIREDATNRLLTFAYARDLKQIRLPEDAVPRMRAVKAFIDALKDDTPIILFWS